MTPRFELEYFPRVMNRWQHTNAFVIQFRPVTDLAAGQCEGRVEHIATSRTVHFGSLAELLTFIERALSDVQTESQSQESTLFVKKV